LHTSSTASCCLLRTSTISFGVSHAFFNACPPQPSRSNHEFAST
jgi:hypothetical protein